jgi:hypothetical protein
MEVWLIALLLAAHLAFWGAGLAWLAMPRRWRAFWPLLVPAAGLGLQSAVVWWGAVAGAAGTDVYGRWAQLLPGALLGVALAREGARRLARQASRTGLVMGLAGLAVLAVAGAVAAGGAGATTVSLGSCDAADYGAGARVLQEFARSERGGFLGQREVVAILSVDNFFDYWLRLNHFTPAALLALNATLLGRAPHELATVHTGLLLAALVPAVFWAARALFGQRGALALVVAAAAAVSPVWWYAVAHVAPGQLLAAQALVWVSWGGVVLTRGRASWACAPLLALGYWLVAGAYNFLLPAILLPAGLHAAFALRGAGVIVRGARWAGVMLAPLAIVALAFPTRFAGYVERLTLLRTHDFGWRIPALTPEGWIGLVGGSDLAAWPVAGVRVVLAAGVVALWLAAGYTAARRRPAALALPLAVLAPVVAGYALLQARGAWWGTNASYDAYKLLAVFYPLVLPLLWSWATLRQGGGPLRWFGVSALVVAVLAGGAFASARILVALAQAPLRVTPDLAALRAAEDRPELAAGVNLLIPDMWSRLWANAFLLRRPQHFETHTYEARRDTPLRGAWDLQGGVVGAGAASGGRLELSPRFALVPAGYLRATATAGWFPVEQAPVGGRPWQWMGAEAELEVRNPGDTAILVTFTLRARGWGVRTLTLRNAEAPDPGAALSLGAEETELVWRGRVAPPGVSRWVLASAEPARPAGGRDPRDLAVQVFRLTVDAAGR